MKKMNPVVHFEMPMKDMERMKKFYESAFGWEMQQMGAEYGDYIVAMTTESDENGPKRSGAINGGFYKLYNKQQDAAPSVVISVDDIKVAMEDVKNAGGKVLSEIMDIPHVGQYVAIMDTEGNRVGILQPAKM